MRTRGGLPADAFPLLTDSSPLMTDDTCTLSEPALSEMVMWSVSIVASFTPTSARSMLCSSSGRRCASSGVTMELGTARRMLDRAMRKFGFAPASFWLLELPHSYCPGGGKKGKKKYLKLPP